MRTLVDRAFESLGHLVTPAYEVSYVPTALGLVKAGLGIAVIAFSAADEAATQSAGLRARVIEHPALVREIGLIESTGRSLSPSAQQFASAIRDACRARSA